MTTERNKPHPQPGDVFEVPTSNGLAYIQCILSEAANGDLIRVLPGLYPARPPEFAALASQKELYFTFFTLTAALRRREVEWVAHEAIPQDSATRPIMRPAGDRARDGTALYWFLSDGTDEWRVDRLSDREQDLSLEQLWGVEVLAIRLAIGWSPQHDIGVTAARAADPPTTPPSPMPRDADERGTANHYLYFPTARQAADLEECLGESGYAVEVRESDMEKAWLCLVTHQVAPGTEDLTAVRERLSALADSCGGEYDGWEFHPLEP